MRKLHLLFLSTLLSCGGDVNGSGPTLPDQVGAWRVAEADATYDRETLYDYMNGGAEVYLSYDFRRVWVRRFTDPDGEEMVSLNGTIQLGPGPAAGGGRIRVPHILNMDGLVFKKAGTHVFDVSLDGEHSVTIPLRVQSAGPRIDGPVVQA